MGHRAGQGQGDGKDPAMRARCRRAALLCLLLAPLTTLCAKSARPPSGETVNEVRTVALQHVIAGPCAAVSTGRLTLYLSLDRLRQHAKRPSVYPAGLPEEERLARIFAGRVRGLLAKLGQVPDRDGCLPVQGPLGADEFYAIVDEIEEGAVAAKLNQSGAALTALELRFVGMRCAPLCGRGDIIVGIPGEQGAEIAVNWWVS